MRIIFMGTPDFAVPVLDALVAAGHEVVLFSKADLAQSNTRYAQGGVAVVTDVPDRWRPLTAIGDEGVLAMVCDSTNVFVDGVAGSEGGVREALTKLIGGLKGRVAVGCFASNVARMDSVIRAAEASGRARHLQLVELITADEGVELGTHAPHHRVRDLVLGARAQDIGGLAVAHGPGVGHGEACRARHSRGGVGDRRWPAGRDRPSTAHPRIVTVP